MTTTTVDAWLEARTAHQIAADELEFELSLVVRAGREKRLPRRRTPGTFPWSGCPRCASDDTLLVELHFGPRSIQLRILCLQDEILNDSLFSIVIVVNVDIMFRKRRRMKRRLTVANEAMSTIW